MRNKLLGTSPNLLRDSMAALRGTRPLAYLPDRSRALHSVRLALKPLATVFRGALLLGLTLCVSLNTHAADNEELNTLREELRQLRQSYQQKLEQLEARLQHAEQRAATPATAAVTPPHDHDHHDQHTPHAPGHDGNPAVTLYLSGTYGHLQRDPAQPATGFAMSPRTPQLNSGFSLRESELLLAGEISPLFSGFAALALAPEGGVSMENAFIDASAPNHGLRLRLGRFFSGIGLLNPQHAHDWDFIDQPLVYQALWNNQLGEDGVQLKWASGTGLVELGAEMGRGRTWPGTDRQNRNGSAAGAAFLRLDDRTGDYQHWRLGMSLHQTRQADWLSNGVPDLAGTPGGASFNFSGDVHTYGLDFLWQYAPNDDAKLRLQGEYFHRRQNGLLTYDPLLSNITDSYALSQSGGYLQGVYQFLPEWRLGVRQDQLNPGIASVGALNAANVISHYRYTPRRTSAVLEYGNNAARLRLQLARDQSRQAQPDQQILLQYVMRLGAPIRHHH